ncbi:MAG: GC-type dockerin domain-anchored protein [Planctomycetota bacterium]
MTGTAAAQWTGSNNAKFPEDLLTEGDLIEAVNLGPQTGAQVTVNGITYTADDSGVFDAFGFADTFPAFNPPVQFSSAGDSPEVVAILDTARTYYQPSFFAGGPSESNMFTVPLTAGRTYRAQLVIGHAYDFAGFGLYPDRDLGGEKWYNAGDPFDGVSDISINEYEFVADFDSDLGDVIGSWSVAVADNEFQAHLLAYTLHDITEVCPLERLWTSIPDASFPADLKTDGVVVEALNLGATFGSEVTVGGITYTVDPSFFDNAGIVGAPTPYLSGDADADQILGTSRFYQNFFFGDGPNQTNMFTLPLIEGNRYRAQLVIGHLYDFAGLSLYPETDGGGSFFYNVSNAFNGTADISISTLEFIAENDADLGGVANAWSMTVSGGEQFAELLAYTLHDITDVCDLPNSCPADLAEPFGVLDLDDIDAFIIGFLASDAIADLAAPFGVIDLSDIDVFIVNFLGGCP